MERFDLQCKYLANGKWRSILESGTFDKAEQHLIQEIKDQKARKATDPKKYRGKLFFRIISTKTVAIATV